MPKNAYFLKICEIAAALGYCLPAAGGSALTPAFRYSFNECDSSVNTYFITSTSKNNRSNKQQMFCFCFFPLLFPFFISNSAITANGGVKIILFPAQEQGRSQGWAKGARPLPQSKCGFRFLG